MYTADTVKIIGSCTFDIVHPDTKKLVPVTFYVANNDVSILLSCTLFDSTKMKIGLSSTMS